MQEPDVIQINLIIFAIPFLLFYLGIVIRKVCLPGKDSPPLGHQLLLGIPVSLVIVAPMLTVLKNSFDTDLSTYLFTLGVIIEHGMLLNETITKHLRRMIGSA